MTFANKKRKFSSALIATLLVLSLTMVLMMSSLSLVTVVQAQDPLSTAIDVPAQEGMNQFIFELGNSERLELDIINPTEAFQFKLEYYGMTGPQSSKFSPKSARIAFFRFKILDEESHASLKFGGGMRFIYNDAYFNANPSTLSWFLLRSDKWRNFSQASVVSTLTRTVSQSFSREDLRPGETHFGVFGGATSAYPSDDYDYELYLRYDQVITAKQSIQNKYSFGLPQEFESFEMEIIGADRTFNFTLTRSDENPDASASFKPGTNMALFFFKIQIQGTMRPIYNAIFRYKFKQLNANVEPGTMTFGYLKGGAYSGFKWDSVNNERSGEISQSASSIDDSMGNPIQLAVLAQKKGSSVDPQPSTSTSGGSGGEPGTSPSPSPSSPGGVQPSSSSSSVEPRESSHKHNGASGSSTATFILQVSLALCSMVAFLFM